MAETAPRLGRSSHSDRTGRRVMAAWPRVCDIALAALYLSVGRATVRDWVKARLLRTVEFPGTTLRRDRRIVAGPRARTMHKAFVTIEELDRFVDEQVLASRKGGEEGRHDRFVPDQGQ